MANNAHITLYGTVLQDPTNKQVNSSTVLSMRVAVQTTKKQQNSQYPASDVYDVSVWGKAAEALMPRVKKSSKVLVIGDFMLGDTWEDRQGEKHTNLRVNANSVTVLSGTPTNNNNNNNTEEDQEAPF